MCVSGLIFGAQSWCVALLAMNTGNGGLNQVGWTLSEWMWDHGAATSVAITGL